MFLFHFFFLPLWKPSFPFRNVFERNLEFFRLQIFNVSIQFSGSFKIHISSYRSDSELRKCREKSQTPIQDLQSSIKKLLIKLMPTELVLVTANSRRDNWKFIKFQWKWVGFGWFWSGFICWSRTKSLYKVDRSHIVWHKFVHIHWALHFL